MKRLILLGLFLSTTSFANTKEDIAKTEQTLEKLFADAGQCIVDNIPSAGTLTVDAIVDSCLRQITPIANAIGVLEKKNPVNGAIVRDFSKAITVVVKRYLDVPVDQTGRRYDDSDLYAQLVKVGAKVLGFAGLYATGFIDNGLLQFLVNNGGDVMSQGVLDSGKVWRTNQTIAFNEFLAETYSIKNSIVSIPAKGIVSYTIGEAMKRVSLIDAVELALFVMLNQVAINKADPFQISATWAKKVPFMPGFVATFVTCVVKSLVLTTLCKSAVQGVNTGLDTYAWPYWNYVWQPANATASAKRDL